MTEEVAPKLAKMLRGQSGLVRLNLTDTSLQDEGISIIAEVLSPTFPACRAACRLTANVSLCRMSVYFIKLFPMRSTSKPSWS